LSSCRRGLFNMLYDRWEVEMEMVWMVYYTPLELLSNVLSELYLSPRYYENCMYLYSPPPSTLLRTPLHNNRRSCIILHVIIVVKPTSKPIGGPNSGVVSEVWAVPDYWLELIARQTQSSQASPPQSQFQLSCQGSAHQAAQGTKKQSQ
jgi:hypothetical protein